MPEKKITKKKNMLKKALAVVKRHGICAENSKKLFFFG